MMTKGDTQSPKKLLLRRDELQQSPLKQDDLDAQIGIEPNLSNTL